MTIAYNELPPEILLWSIKQVFLDHTELASATDLRTDIVSVLNELNQHLVDYLEKYPRCSDRKRFQLISDSVKQFAESMKNLELIV